MLTQRVDTREVSGSGDKQSEGSNDSRQPKHCATGRGLPQERLGNEGPELRQAGTDTIVDEQMGAALPIHSAPGNLRRNGTTHGSHQNAVRLTDRPQTQFWVGRPIVLVGGSIPAQRV